MAVNNNPQDLLNDEHVASMQLLNKMLTVLNQYVSTVKSTNEDFDNRAVQQTESQKRQMQNCSDKYEQKLTQLEYERTSVLENWEKEYKGKLGSEAERAASYKREKESITRNSQQYQADMRKQVENRKKQLAQMMDQIARDEKNIAAPKYRRIVKKKLPIEPVPATNLDGIMALNPTGIVNEINMLNEKFLRKLIRAATLNARCMSFYSLRIKANEFYQKEIKETDALISESNKKAARMITDASARFNHEMGEHEDELGNMRKIYIDYCVEVNTQYDDDRKKTIEEQARQKFKLTEQHAQQDEKLKKDRQQALMDAYQELQRQMLREAPPEMVAAIIKAQTERKTILPFKPAVSEPENVTIGEFNYRLEKVLNNKLVNRFMMQHYAGAVQNGSIALPFTICLNQNFALVFRYDSAQSQLAKEHIQTICLNAFLLTPPNKMRFHFFDPLKSGQSFAIFKHFEDDLQRSYNIILGGIQTDTASIEQQLQIVVDHIKTMQVNTFKGQYKNIREYNAANTLNPQPYNIIGIMDFPAGFSQQAVGLLQQIVVTGKDCGVYAVIMSDKGGVEAVDPKIKAQIHHIEDAATIYELRGQHYVRISKGKADENLQLNIDKPLGINEIVSLAPTMKKGIKDAGRIVIDYRYIAPPKEKHFSLTNDNGLVIPIGMSGASDIQYLTLGIPGSQSVHALIGGQIGSGKSRLLHAIITGAILQYSPQELEIYLVDFKSGTEFKIYADYNLPNFRVIAIESEQEFGLSVLQSINEEKERRARIFNSCSKSDITAYNASLGAGGEKLPRILVVIDEFHELFKGTDPEVTREASRLLDNILRLQRSFGVHVVLCTQSVRGLSEVDEAAMTQIAVRIALKCPKEDADILLGRGSDAMAQIEENDAGSAIYLPAISTPKTNNKFRVGFISQDEHKAILSGIERHYDGNTKYNSARVLVSDVADSRGNVFQKYLKQNLLAVENRKLYFGEPLSIDSTLAAAFLPARGGNMLLAGKNRYKANSIMFFMMLSMVLNKLKEYKSGAKPDSIYLFDFAQGIGGRSEMSLIDAALLLPDYIDGVEPCDALERFTGIFNQYRQRQSPQENVWILINNMALASDFQSAVYSSSQQGFSMLQELLRNGPQKGFFTVAWHDDLALMRQKFPDILESFGHRIAFDMNDDDALNFADVVKDQSINKNNAVYFEKGKGKQKFRPYSMPIKEWVNNMFGKIGSEQIY